MPYSSKSARRYGQMERRERERARREAYLNEPGINGPKYREQFLAWLEQRIIDVGYTPKTAPSYLKKAYKSGNPKDLSHLIWSEWYDHNNPDWRSQIGDSYEVGPRGGVYRYSSTGRTKIYV